MFSWLATSEHDTHKLAGVLGKLLAAQGVVYLQGDLGAGKTTFCRGILRAYGYEGAVKSPTFTLVEPYDLEWGQVYHFDLYRIADPEELEYLGIDDYLSGGNLCLIEWWQRGEGFLPAADLLVDIQIEGLQRHFKIAPKSELGEKIVIQLTKQLN